MSKARGLRAAKIGEPARSPEEGHDTAQAAVEHAAVELAEVVAILGDENGPVRASFGVCTSFIAGAYDRIMTPTRSRPGRGCRRLPAGCGGTGAVSLCAHFTLRSLYDQNGAAGMMGHAVGGSPEQKRLDAAQAPAAQNDQVTALLLGHADDLGGRLADFLAALIGHAHSLHDSSGGRCEGCRQNQGEGGGRRAAALSSKQRRALEWVRTQEAGIRGVTSPIYAARTDSALTFPLAITTISRASRIVPIPMETA